MSRLPIWRSVSFRSGRVGTICRRLEPLEEKILEGGDDRLRAYIVAIVYFECPRQRYLVRYGVDLTYAVIGHGDVKRGISSLYSPQANIERHSHSDQMDVA